MKQGKVLRNIFVTIFIDLLGIGILIPVLPELFVDPRSPSYVLGSHASINTGFLLLGFLIALFPIGQFFATPILGQLSDRYGRKKVLVFSILGTSISYVLFAIGIIQKNIPLLFFSRFFDGITGGNISVAQAAIADITTKENRAKNFGLIGAAFGLGFIFGPYIGGKLADPQIVSWFNASTPFWFAAILAFVNGVLVLSFLPETHKNLLPVKVTLKQSILNIKKAFSLPRLKGLFATSFFFSAGFAFFGTFFNVFLITKFDFTQNQVGNFFAYVGLWAVVVQLLITRFLAKRFSQEDILKFSLIWTSVMLVIYFLPEKSWQLYFIPPFFALGTGLTMANMTAIISSKADQTIQGEILGIGASVQALAQSIPPILAGTIAAVIAPRTPILVAAGVVFVSWVIFLLTTRKITQNL